MLWIKNERKSNEKINVFSQLNLKVEGGDQTVQSHASSRSYTVSLAVSHTLSSNCLYFLSMQHIFFFQSKSLSLAFILKNKEHFLPKTHRPSEDWWEGGGATNVHAHLPPMLLPPPTLLPPPPPPPPRPPSSRPPPLIRKAAAAYCGADKCSRIRISLLMVLS